MKKLICIVGAMLGFLAYIQKQAKAYTFATRWRPLVEAHSQGVDPALVEAIIWVESKSFTVGSPNAENEFRIRRI